MKKYMMFAATAALLIATPALAGNPNQGGGNNNGGIHDSYNTTHNNTVVTDLSRTENNFDLSTTNLDLSKTYNDHSKTYNDFSRDNTATGGTGTGIGIGQGGAGGAGGQGGQGGSSNATGGRSDANAEASLGNLNKFGGDGGTAVSGSLSGAYSEGSVSGASATGGSATGGSIGAVSSVSEGSAASSDNAVTINDNDQFYYEAMKRTAQTAVAPPVINVAPCTVGGSAALQTPSFGVSLGGGKANVNCEVNVRTGLISGLSKTDGEDYLAAHDPVYSKILADRRNLEAKRLAALADSLRREDMLAKTADKAPPVARTPRAALNPGITIGVSSQPFSTAQAKGTMAPIPN